MSVFREVSSCRCTCPNGQQQIGYIDEPLRVRKLLLKAKQIIQLDRATQEQGVTLVPLKVYFNEGYVKLELAIAKGKDPTSDKNLYFKTMTADEIKARAENFRKLLADFKKSVGKT